jgi:hypothetical protein
MDGFVFYSAGAGSSGLIGLGIGFIVGTPVSRIIEPIVDVVLPGNLAFVAPM